jgi:hypothetical protein
VSAREEALARIVELARAHALSPADVTAALQAGAGHEVPARPARQGVLGRVFAWLGGTLVVAGVFVLIATQWDGMGFAERVIASLGTGLTALVLAYMASLYPGRERLVTPLFLIAVLTEPLGLVVVLEEFSSGGNETLGVLAVAGVMTLQCVLFLTRVQRSAVVFAALGFGGAAVSAALALVGIEDELNAVLVGVSLFLVTLAVRRSAHAPIAPFWFFVSSGLVLGAWFALVERGPLEISELALVAACIWASTVLRSRTLLATGTIAFLVYVGYFSGRHFADSVGWPLLLIALGVLMMAAGTAAVRIHRRYIKPAA